MNKEQEFTIAQFYDDITENAKVICSKLGAFSDGNKLVFNLSENEKINAKVQDIKSGKQYLITHYTGLANRLYQNAFSISDKWERLYPNWTNGTRDFIARAIAGCSSEMVFWHEYAHIVGGHMPFLKSQGEGTGEEIYEISAEAATNSLEKRKLIRFIETDADIYGAQFSLARVMTVISAKNNQFPEEVWIAIYTLGIRSMYNAIFNDLEDAYPEGFNHPHSLARAYGAVSHGIEAASRSGIHISKCDKWREVAFTTLLAYESELIGTTPSIETLEKFIAEELVTWNSMEKELASFRIKLIAQKNFWSSVKVFS